MYACESSIKVMLLDTEGYSFFENNFPKCDIHADSVRARKEKKYLLCPPILVARGHYTWNGLSDEVVKTS